MDSVFGVEYTSVSSQHKKSTAAAMAVLFLCCLEEKSIFVKWNSDVAGGVIDAKVHHDMTVCEQKVAGMELFDRIEFVF